MEHLLTYGYLGLALCAFLAGTPLPMNSEAALSLALVSGMPVVPCVVSCIVGNWLGASVNYILGRMLSYEQMLRWTKANPEKLEKVRLWLSERGVWFALGSSLPIIGNLVIISYGLLRTPFAKVGAIMLLGQIVRFSLWAFSTLFISIHVGGA